MALNDDALTTVATARLFLNDPNADSTVLEKLINSKSRTIRSYTGRQFLPREIAGTTKKFRYDGRGMLLLGQSSSWATELAAVTAVVLFSDLPTSSQSTLSAGVAGTTEADYRLGPRPGTRESTYLWLELPTVPMSAMPVGPSPGGWTLEGESKGVEVSITGTWGANVTPGDVEEACLIAVQHSYRNRGGFSSQSLGGLSISDPSEGGFDTGSGLPRASRSLLYEYRRDTYLS